MIRIEKTGQQKTVLFHQITLDELLKKSVQLELQILRIVPEQTVLLEPLNGNGLRAGRFDFLVSTKDNRTIGFEVLLRPTHGKMTKKLAYAKQVDEFVFVLPFDSFSLYRKQSKKGFPALGHKHFFSPSFAKPHIKAWLVNEKTGEIETKKTFSELFHTKSK